MKMAIEIDWQRQEFVVPVERVQLADELGYDMAFTAEYTGSDALTPLGYILGLTKRIGLGTRIVQTTARSPAATMQAFQTLRHMAGPDREIVAGIGSSSPACTEGWHGRPWTPPYWRMRDWVAIMRKVAKGQPVAHEGRTISIPWHAPDAKAAHEAQSSIMNMQDNVPIMFGGGTEMMLVLAAEIADGLLPNGSWSPGSKAIYWPMIEKGLKKSGRAIKVEDFPIWAHVDVLVTNDIKAAMAEFKEYTARWSGGYGGAGGLDNQLIWRGYGDALARVKELYQAGHIKEAEAAVPDEYIDECWLLGPMERILDRWRSKWIDSGANIIVRTDNWPSAKPAGNEVYAPLIKALRD